MSQIPLLVKEKIKYYLHQREWLEKIKVLNNEYHQKITNISDTCLLYKNGELIVVLDPQEQHRERRDFMNNPDLDGHFIEIHSFIHAHDHEWVYSRKCIRLPSKYRYSSTKNDLLQSMLELNSGHLLCGLKPIYPYELLD
jgi:hypothetical protein